MAANFSDRKLARDAYSGQQTEEPGTREGSGNLTAPVAGDWSAHGRFDERAKRFSIALWLRINRAVAALVLLLVLVALGFLALH